MAVTCLLDGRICRPRIAIWAACLPPPVLGSDCWDCWAFLQRDLVGAIGHVHWRATWLMPAGLVGSVEWRCHWPYSLIFWRSSRLIRQFLLRQFQKVIRRRLQHTVPSPLSWSWCRLAVDSSDMMVIRMDRWSLASEVETDQSYSSAMSLEAKLMSGEFDRSFVGSRGA